MPLEIVAVYRDAPPKKNGRWTSYNLARTLYAEAPFGTIPSDQLALMILVEERALSIQEIMDAFEIPRATASDLVSRAVKARRVKTYAQSIRRKPDAKQAVRYHFVELAPRGVRERTERRRGK